VFVRLWCDVMCDAGEFDDCGDFRNWKCGYGALWVYMVSQSCHCTQE
jgi:hypothetical protein